MSEELIARTHFSDHSPEGPFGDHDLVFEGPDVRLVGRGIARRIPVGDGPDRLARASHDTARALDAIVDDGPAEIAGPGVGPLALGALPFASSAPGSLVIPALIHGWSADGYQWTTRIGTRADLDRHTEPVRTTPSPDPTTVHTRTSRTDDEWCQAVTAAVDAIRSGELRKVVLARELIVDADRPFSPGRILARLAATYPHAYRWSLDGFIGASPELLVRRAGDLVAAQPMAGTVPRGLDPAADAAAISALKASANFSNEHQITIDAVLDGLLPFCSYVDADADPVVVSLANVSHLATSVHGRLSAPEASVLALVAALHPTPAVGGAPTANALAVIDRIEAIDRARYAGPVGWVDAAGNGTFAVGIRSAELDGNHARLFAGNGIVADSDPAQELRENDAKMSALAHALTT